MGVTSCERFPIYELWDQNRNHPADHYTVFEYVVDKATGSITDGTRCPDGKNTGMTPCSYATSPPYNRFEDDLRLGSTTVEVNQLQSFQYGLPGQRKWKAELYRSPTVVLAH
jgi:hypothetical protein